MLGVIIGICGLAAVIGALFRQISIGATALSTEVPSALAVMFITGTVLWMQVANRLTWPTDLHTLPEMFWIVTVPAFIALTVSTAVVITRLPSEAPQWWRLKPTTFAGIGAAVLAAPLMTYAQSWYAGHSLATTGHPTAVVSMVVGQSTTNANGVSIPVSITARNAGESPLVVIGSALWVIVEEPGSANQRLSSALPDKAVDEAFFSEYRPEVATDDVSPPALLAAARPIPILWELNKGEEYHSTFVFRVSNKLSSKLIRFNAQLFEANSDILSVETGSSEAARRLAVESGYMAPAVAWELQEPSWLVTISRPTLGLAERWDWSYDEMSVVSMFHSAPGASLLTPEQWRGASRYYGIYYTATHIELTLPAANA